jgi:hypothetical protein
VATFCAALWLTFTLPLTPDSTIRIFSSEECSLRVARRISFTTCSAGAFVVTGFFIIFNSNSGKDEPQTLHYAITQNCSMGADVRQTRDTGLAKTSADFLDFTGRFMPAITQKLSAAHCDPIAN